VKEPRNSDEVAFLKTVHVFAFSYDDSGYLMSQDDRHRHARLESLPFTAGDVDVAVTGAASRDAQQDLARARFGHLDILDDERLTEFVQSCSFHSSARLVISIRR
jgi:hypothetical protein